MVTIKGIDNDASFSQYRVGAMKFSLDKSRSNVFRSQVLLIAQKIDPANAEALSQRLLQNPGITENPNGTFTIDASKITDKTITLAILRVTGAQTLALPDKIDRETYDAIVALKEGPQRQTYLDSIRPRLSEASYNAAVSRLDDVIALTEQFQSENKVINNDAWANVQETPLQTGNLTTSKLNGNEKRLNGDIAKDTNKAFCPSVYARDGFEKFFR